jgi:quinoprotein glucose dehydrogenase
LKVEVWASEPLMENPVSFAFDEKGRVYVAETNRFHTGVPDTRDHMYWLDEDLANRSIDDLVAMYKKHKFGPWYKYHDQLRLVWDSNNDGKADKSEIFSGGYNRPQDGLAAGVLARKGKVYFTCIPDLYLLKDTDGDNKADEKKSLFTGFGPTAQFLGHDLHGLRMGPDGKLYFSVGDRGFNVTTKEGKKLQYPNTGAVLRCDPDGSNLEVVHYGLRNPQELAFDDYGNLFTYDNNSDSGDRARWVYIVEGGDSGWRGGYQYGTSYHLPGTPQGNRGPWNSEQIWHVPDADSHPPAYVVPPLANFGNGPAGITHYPGIGLNEKYKDHFFACDFTSNPGSSMIWSLSVKPKGAGFEVVKPEPFVRGMVPTDCDFGPDGAFYWSDWVGGWNPPGKGRIFKLTDPEAMKDPAVAEAKKLLAEGMEKRPVEELAKLLGHSHQQVRLEAQWELAKHDRIPGNAALVSGALASVAKHSKNGVARLHAIWAMRSLSSDAASHAANECLVELTKDKDAEVRANAIKLLGEFHPSPEGPLPSPFAFDAREAALRLLTDPEPRVRYFAALAYGRVGALSRQEIAERGETHFVPLLDFLKSNNDSDPYLRHAAVMGLTELTFNAKNLWRLWTATKDKYDTPSVRLGVLLALRRLKSDKTAEFLADVDPRIVAEAARAIHDERIEGALAKLAILAEKPGPPDAVSYRALSANFIFGTAAAAEGVAMLAARST